MEKFKVELFKKEYGREFPSYKELSKNECNYLIDKIVKKYNLKDRNNIVSEITLKQSYLNNNANNNFNIVEILNELHIEPAKTIYLNWYKYDDIDVVDIETINDYFYDIWFPAADDIDFFDLNLNWILSVRHDGAIYYLIYT